MIAEQAGGPLQYFRVFLARHPGILHANNIKVGHPAQDSPQDTVIEIFIGCQAQHLFCR
ncbi:MAG TPA: hypothetical protein VNO70_24085 [Blastocatellia bacterium]|nr:hypothetical protein [Blastocatellia bacterium]